eukprot:GHVT01087720.1.p1 GENE.GHVT01087720.1~~GHVT01087720.1.p1  ORF type:complete len:899 (+),score=103.41 GHVT01087720.1:251-2947(+)
MEVAAVTNELRLWDPPCSSSPRPLSPLHQYRKGIEYVSSSETSHSPTYNYYTFSRSSSRLPSCSFISGCSSCSTSVACCSTASSSSPPSSACSRISLERGCAVSFYPARRCFSGLNLGSVSISWSEFNWPSVLRPVTEWMGPTTTTTMSEIENGRVAVGGSRSFPSHSRLSITASSSASLSLSSSPSFASICSPSASSYHCSLRPPQQHSLSCSSSKMGLIIFIVCLFAMARLPLRGYAQLKILAPKSLVKTFNSQLHIEDGAIPAATATFGAPDYTEVLLGRLIFFPSPSRWCESDLVVARNGTVISPPSVSPPAVLPLDPSSGASSADGAAFHPPLPSSSSGVLSNSTSSAVTPIRSIQESTNDTNKAPDDANGQVSNVNSTVSSTASDAGSEGPGTNSSPDERSSSPPASSGVLRRTTASVGVAANKLQSNQEGSSTLFPGMRLIFLVERGGCPFVTKMRHCQANNADAVVFIDSADSHWSRDEIKHVIISDNEHARDIRIPSIMITHSDGATLLASMLRNNRTSAIPPPSSSTDVSRASSSPVFVELQWDLPSRAVVDVDYWSDPGNLRSTEFLSNFAPVAAALKDHMRFDIHYFIFAIPPPLASDSDCLFNSTFCATPPVVDTVRGSKNFPKITGRDIVTEGLWQMCIFDSSKTKTSLDPDALWSQMFWEYLRRFGSECSLTGTELSHRFGPECRERVMADVKLNVSSVKGCVDGSRGKELLEQQRDNRAWSVNAIRINEARLSGTLDVEHVTKAVCSSFLKAPPACEELLRSFRNGSSPSSLSDSSPTDSSATVAFAESGSGSNTFVLVLLFLVLLFGGVFLYQYQIRKGMRDALREEVAMEVLTQMQEYRQLPGGGRGQAPQSRGYVEPRHPSVLGNSARSIQQEGRPLIV